MAKKNIKAINTTVGSNSLTSAAADQPQPCCSWLINTRQQKIALVKNG